MDYDSLPSFKMGPLCPMCASVDPTPKYIPGPGIDQPGHLLWTCKCTYTWETKTWTGDPWGDDTPPMGGGGVMLP